MTACFSVQVFGHAVTRRFACWPCAGSPKEKARQYTSWLISHREQHSQKPAVVREKIVELMGDLPRVELFARQRADGWDAWGDEVESDFAMKPEGMEER